MAWTSPMTFIDGRVLTAAQLNTHLRDNLLETATARSTGGGGYFVTVAPGEIAEREYGSDRVSNSETSDSESFTDLSTFGPSVTVKTGTQAWVHLYCGMHSDGANNSYLMGFDVTGDSSIEASDSRSIQGRVNSANLNRRMAASFVVSNLTSGSNVFTAKYRVESGSGTFTDRAIAVFPL